MIQFPNHYAIFFFEAFLLGNEWSLFQFCSALLSFVSLSKTCGDYAGHQDQKDEHHSKTDDTEKAQKNLAILLFCC